MAELMRYCRAGAGYFHVPDRKKVETSNPLGGNVTSKGQRCPLPRITPVVSHSRLFAQLPDGKEAKMPDYRPVTASP
jgi:hypothetical protein